MAWTTALGHDLDEVWARLLDGASGLAETPSPYALRNTGAAAVTTVPFSAPPAVRQRTMAEEALRRALLDAGLAADASAIQPILGTSYGAHLDDPATSSLSAWALEIADRAGFARHPLVVTTACSAGADTLLMGLELIRGGAAEICVCGGADVLTDAKRLGHSLLGTMSPTGLRAFDASHDGTLLGEGSGFMVVESVRSATARGARVHGLLAGAGSSNDGTGSVAPDASGRSLELAVGRALRSGGVSHDDIAVINAHGSGTPTNDELEARVYSRIFGGVEAPPVMFATKGALGHTLGATGALEAIAVVQALRTGQVPPVRGLTDVPPSLSLPVPVGRPAPVAGDYGLSVTLGFGGFNTCLLFERART
ncbi:beta-ketoacyl synthase N-terminal-like domain-containing protein [Actinomadura terrae]|uniref:beta-ketoacyl synthase N-terminal-like domain-containing protein n=1 Tax=Actinomadura terrae TaxID=604353 RepID=UPI001FA7DF84|nr:beta-ketoacyl synthase N-terminal-like domain-containing protein [Actinomadura terrae]